MVYFGGEVEIKKIEPILKSTDKFNLIPNNIKPLVKEDFKSRKITSVIIDEKFIIVKSDSHTVIYYKDTLIYESFKPRGKDFQKINNRIEEVIADDLKYGDLSNKEIFNINKFYTNWIDELIFTYTKYGKDILGLNFKAMANIFSISSKEMRDTVQDMIDKFLLGNCKSYSNNFLTNNVKLNDKFKNYHKEIERLLNSKLIEHKGNLFRLEAKKKNTITISSRYDGEFQKLVEDTINKPAFTGFKNMTNGLKIAINGVWGCRVKVKNYRIINNNFYKGIIEHNLYDNFGLNKDDMNLSNINKKIYMNNFVEGLIQKNIPIVRLAFDDWFVLQRSKKLHEKIRNSNELPPKPFIVDMNIEEKFCFRN